MLSIVLLSVFGIVNLFLGFQKKRSIVLSGAIIFLLITFVVNLLDWQSPIHLGDRINIAMFQTDKVTVLFTAILLLIAILILPLSVHYIQDKEAQPAEYYAILLFSLVGAIMMVGYESLIMLFVGLEILSVSMYILTGADKRNVRSNEAAMKYFLMGAFATGILLFGFAMLYGATGAFSITEIQKYVTTTQQISPLLYVGLLFTLFGILFKVSIAPFHFWTPDVYDGAPTVFTAFMSTIVKTAGFAALYRLLSASFSSIYDFWWMGLAVMCGLTLLIGNVTAVWQQSFKRMMAYSSISHAGYLLLAVVAMNTSSMRGILFYSLAYSLATVSAFGVLLLVSKNRHSESYEAFNGLARTNPFLAFVMTMAMLSLAGIPLTAGFLGKLFVFVSAYEQGLYIPMILAALMSAVGIYYYFRVIIAMYLKPSAYEGKISVGSPFIGALLASTVLTILLGLFPDWLLMWLN